VAIFFIWSNVLIHNHNNQLIHSWLSSGNIFTWSNMLIPNHNNQLIHGWLPRGNIFTWSNVLIHNHNNQLIHSWLPRGNIFTWSRSSTGLIWRAGLQRSIEEVRKLSKRSPAEDLLKRTANDQGVNTIFLCFKEIVLRDFAILF
jgi:hypothetical protein